MKTSVISVFLLFFCEIIAAQNVGCFEHFQKEGEAAVNRRRPNFELARKKFSAAKECPEATPDQRREMEARIRTVEKANLSALELQIDRAEISEAVAISRAAEAELAREIASKSLDETKKALAEAQRLRLESEAATRHALANDLAFKAQTALRDGDRTTALRLSEFAWRFVEPNNQRARQTILDVFYQNDRRSDAFRQPWRTSNWDTGDELGADRLQFSSDGMRLGVISYSGRVFVWEISSERELFFHANSSANAAEAAFSSDLTKIAILTDQSEMTVFDISTNLAPQKIKIPNNAGFVSAAFSKNGQNLTVSTSDWTVETFDVATGNLLPPMDESLKKSFATICTADNRFSLIFEPNGQITVLDLKKNERQSTFNLSNPYPTAVDFSPQNKLVAVACADRSISIWRLFDGQKMMSFPPQNEAATQLYFSLDDLTLTATFLNVAQKTWDLGTGQALDLLNNPPDDTFFDVLFSPDFSTKMVLSYDRGVEIFDHPLGKKRFGIPNQNETVQYGFSPDGRAIFIGNPDGSALVLDATTGRLLVELPFGNEIVSHIFSADSRQLAIARQRGGVDVWNLDTRAELTECAGKISETRPFFSKNGQYVAISFLGDSMRVYDLATEKVVFSAQNIGSQAIFTPDATKLVTFEQQTDRIFVSDLTKIKTPIVFTLDSARYLYDFKFLKNGQILRVLNNGPMLEFDLISGKIIETKIPLFWEFISKDSQTLVRQSEDRETLEVFDMESGERLWGVKNDQNQPFYSVAISPDGKKLMALINQNVAMIWDIDNGDLQQQIFNEIFQFTYIRWSLDSKHALSTVNWLASWNIETGLLEYSQYLSNPKTVFSSNFERAAAIDHQREVRVIDLQTGFDLVTLRGHTKDITDLQFSPDNETILTTSRDQTARIWDAKTGRELLRLRGDTLEMESAKFSLNGQKIMVLQGQTFKFWDISPDSIILKLKKRGHISGLTAAQIYDFNLEESLVSATDFTQIISKISVSQCLEVARFYAQQADLVNDLARFNLYFERAEMLFQKVANDLGNPSLSLEMADLYTRWSKKLFQNGQKITGQKRAERVEKLLSLPDQLPPAATQNLAFAKIATGKIDDAAQIYRQMAEKTPAQPIEILIAIDELGRLIGSEYESLEPLRNTINVQSDTTIWNANSDTLGYNPESSMAYFEQKNYKKAIELGRLEIQKSLANELNYGQQFGVQNLPDLFGSMAFYLIFDKKYSESIEMANMGLAVDSTRTFIYTNLAHAFLLSGQTEKALGIYKMLKNSPEMSTNIEGENPQTFTQILLNDFELFAQSGIQHRDIPKVIELLLGRKMDKMERAKYF